MNHLLLSSHLSLSLLPPLSSSYRCMAFSCRFFFVVFSLLVVPCRLYISLQLFAPCHLLLLQPHYGKCPSTGKSPVLKEIFYFLFLFHLSTRPFSLDGALHRRPHSICRPVETSRITIRPFQTRAQHQTPSFSLAVSPRRLSLVLSSSVSFLIAPFSTTDFCRRRFRGHINAYLG